MKMTTREVLKNNRRVKRKIGEYVIRLREDRQQVNIMRLKVERFMDTINLLSKKLTMEELRIKEDIDKLVEILQHCYDATEV